MQIRHIYHLSRQFLCSLQCVRIRNTDLVVCGIEQPLLAPADSNMVRHISTRGAHANG